MRRLLLISAVAALCFPLGAAADPVQQGYHLYGRYCISCHAAGGKGSAGRPVGGGPLRTQDRDTGIG